MAYTAADDTAAGSLLSPAPPSREAAVLCRGVPWPVEKPPAKGAWAEKADADASDAAASEVCPVSRLAAAAEALTASVTDGCVVIDAACGCWVDLNEYIVSGDCAMRPLTGCQAATCWSTVDTQWRPRFVQAGKLLTTWPARRRTSCGLCTRSGSASWMTSVRRC